MKVTYRPEKTRGYWTLAQAHWPKLEAAGWHVVTVGSLVTEASKDFISPRQAMLEFEQITGLDVSDDGCLHDSPRHAFCWHGGYAAGAECLGYLYLPGNRGPKTARDVCERLSQSWKSTPEPVPTPPEPPEVPT